jgi:Putative zinc-finger
MPAPKRRTRRKVRLPKDCGCSKPGRGCCGGLLPYMTDFLEGVAGETACQKIRKHLEGCKTCRMHLDMQMGVIRLYKRWRTGAMPGPVRVRLHQRLDQVMSREARR